MIPERIRASRRVRNAAAGVLALALALPAAPARAGAGRVLDFLVPGRAQAREGRTGRAVLLGGIAVVSVAGLGVTTLNYDRAVEEYEDARTRYRDLGRALSRGEVVAWSDITGTWAQMQSALDRSDSRYTTRTVFVGLVAAVYVANAVELLTAGGGDDGGDTGVAQAADAPRWGVDVRGSRVGVYRAFRF